MKSYNDRRAYKQRKIDAVKDKSLSEHEPDKIIGILKAASTYQSSKRKPSMPVMPWKDQHENI